MTDALLHQCSMSHEEKEGETLEIEGYEQQEKTNRHEAKKQQTQARQTDQRKERIEEEEEHKKKKELRIEKEVEFFQSSRA